ncbi:MAG: hypothetical protein KGL39_33795 [Patescibacteria group bacterium]|nr:hypothetical protein [Patescibacteria group bacterium]
MILLRRPGDDNPAGSFNTEDDAMPREHDKDWLDEAMYQFEEAKNFQAADVAIRIAQVQVDREWMALAKRIHTAAAKQTAEPEAEKVAGGAETEAGRFEATNGVHR